MGRELRVDYAWAGIFGMVMDFLPVVGRVPGLDDVWVAGGYSGHGNVLGFACGELVASGGARDGRASAWRSSIRIGCSTSADVASRQESARCATSTACRHQQWFTIPPPDDQPA